MHKLQPKRALPRGFSWSWLLTLALAVLLLWLAFSGVDWSALLATLRQGNVLLLLVAFALLSATYITRSLRWRVLVSAQAWLHPMLMFWGTSVGYLGNNFLPARAGELIRSALIGQRAGISKSYVLATALTERVMDAAFLVLIGLIALSTLETIPDWVQTALLIIAVAAAVGMLSFVVAPRFEPFISRMILRLPLPERLTSRLAGIAAQFLAGMQAFQHGGRALQFGLLTVITWSIDVAFAIQIAAAFQLVLTIPQAVLLLTTLGLSSAAPSTPGYVGIYQFVAITVLMPFGFSQDEALAFILAFQAVTYLVTLLWGGVGVWQFNLHQLRQATADLSHATQAEGVQKDD